MRDTYPMNPKRWFANSMTPTSGIGETGYSAGMSPTASGGAGFDPESVHAKYLAERDRRLVPGRTDVYDLRADAHLARYRDDPFTPYTERDPVVEDVDAVILGGGIAGILAAVQLRKAGVERIRIVDQAGGIGGTWYWNQYPGVMCDIESYIYLPMLEELEYIPSRKYAYGEEIREYLERIGDRYDLVGDALFHTDVTHAEWDADAARWRVTTDRGDELSARYYVLAAGILNLLRIPAIPGIEEFAGPSFHTARWDYSVTGGAAHEPLDELGGKRVALLGTGATGIQVLQPLAQTAEHVYVFQRTPSAIGERGNRPTDPGFAEGLEPGWQRARMDNFQAIMLGRRVDVDLVDDGWTHHYAVVQHPPRREGMTREDFIRGAEELDYSIMEWHRNRVTELVKDPDTAEKLKPYYRYLCKRPCFHDEYLQAFNHPNVTLVDCPAGVERINEKGLVVDGEQYDVELIVFGTGFEPERTPVFRRVGHDVVGRNGISLAKKWADGAQTLFGMMTRGFPNMFIMPAPTPQAVVTVNYTQLAEAGAALVGGAVRLIDAQEAVFEVSEEAEARWTKQIVDAFRDASALMAGCTPSRVNNEGHPELMNPRDGNYGGGQGDFFAYRDLLEGWIADGGCEGLELEVRSPTP